MISDDLILILNRLDSVYILVPVLAPSAINRVFNSRSDQIKDKKGVFAALYFLETTVD